MTGSVGSRSTPVRRDNFGLDNCSRFIMHLVTCARPQEPFEAAPISGLLADRQDGNRWDGFWATGSDEYYVRRTSENGETEWFRLEDELPSRAGEAREAREVRALALRSAAQARVAVVVAKSPDGRRMLVGSARRTTR